LMTSSARSRPACEVVRPSALAVLRLIISSNRVGCWTGRSADLAPRETDQLNPLPVNRQPGVWFDPQAEDGRRLRGQFRRASLGPSQQHRADSCRARFTGPAVEKGEINARVACRACPSHTLDPPGIDDHPQQWQSTVAFGHGDDTIALGAMCRRQALESPIAAAVLEVPTS